MRETRQHGQPIPHTIYQRGVVMMRDITYTNWVRIGEKRVALNDLPQRQQEQIADSLLYRPLATIANVKVVRSA